MGQHKTKIIQDIAEDILREMQNYYRDLIGNNACLLYCHLRDYINETYLSEDKQ